MIVQLNLNNKPEIGDILIIDPFINFSLTCIENKIDYKFSVEGKFKDEYMKPDTFLYKTASAFIKNNDNIYSSNEKTEFKILK